MLLEGDPDLKYLREVNIDFAGAGLTLDQAREPVYRNINGVRTITAVPDENTFEFTAGSSATATSSAIGGGSPRIVTGAATTEFSEQSYSALRGYPAAVTFHQNRLWFGGTPSQPDTIWSSKSNDFFNFDVGTAATGDSIELVASIGEINTIRHMISNRDLHVFTSTSEFFVPAFSNTPISPTNAQVKRQTPFGSNFVKPILLDGTTTVSYTHLTLPTKA